MKPSGWAERWRCMPARVWHVHLICATRGEVGVARDEFMKGYNSVAELRVAELNCAAKVLGLAGVHLLNYRDSGMANTPDNEHPRALAAQPVEEGGG